MMKHKGSSYCCRWFTLFLLAMGIVLVSPDIHTNFADNNKQTTTKGTTATTTTTIMSTTTTTTMQANTMRTMKMLEAMGFIDANRYNVNEKNAHNNNNNNNNLNNYHSNMLIANSNRNSKNSNKMYISAPSKQELWRQQLQQLADRAPPAEKVVQEPGPELELELEEHMVSTPQSMTIMVEKPTTSPAAAAAAATTTTIKPKTTTIINPTTIATKTLSVSTATKLAASKPTTTTITIATSAITTRHSGSTIKLPPDNMANINVSGINARGTMINKQQLQRQNEQQQQQQPQKQQPHWQHESRQQQQQQPQHAQTLVVVAGNRRAEQPQKYIGHTLSSDSGSTQASAALIVATPVRRGGELANVTATTQTQIAINGKSKSSSSNNNNRNSDIVDGITTPITATTTRITVVDTFIITPTPPPTTTTKTLTTQSKQFESARILYDYKATDANDATDDLKRTTETDAHMIVAGHEEMEVVRQYQHKFSSSYLDAAGNKDHAAAAHYGNTHSFAALVQMSAKQQQQQQRQQQQRNRWVRQAEEEPIDKCRKFNEGDAAKNEFYSPDYPNDYPKNISCTRVIIAPPGQIIRLDFRNSFHIEAKEECKFDVLEIRDGQYGFSNLLGKFCGTDFPPEITSKERYLWLHFQSDESIEYSGFTAVYEFMDRSKEAPTTDLNCTIEKSGFEDFVNSTDVPEDIRDTVIKNRVPLDCIWRIQVQENWKIQMKFVDFRLVKPNDCEANFLDIFPEQTIMPLRKKNFCGSAGEGITSDSNTLNIRFFAEPAAINSTFSILFTAFRDKGSGSCTDEEYDCEDATCIDRKLRCNSRDNCKFRWDEEGCNKETSEVSEHIYIIMVVFGLILGGMILTFLVNCIRKIMHDQKIIREHIRQSKESKLNELGRNSKARSRENLSSTMPRPKHSQTSLQILNDASNRYYREVVPMSRASSKSDLKEREHSILRQRNDIVVQTSFCVDDNSSEATVEAALAANACDMGCQTRESLFATPLMHQNSMGSLKDKASLHSRSRFSTFGYEAAQPTPPPPSQQPASARGGQLTGLNIRDAREYIEMRERHPGPKPKMPHMHRMDALPPTPPTPAAPPEMCHHHHQHAAHTHVHTQQQQQQPQQSRQQSAQQQQQLSMQSSKESAGGGGGRSTAAATTTVTTATSAQGKGKPKLSQSTAYIDIRNSAPDVIIMTSH